MNAKIRMKVGNIEVECEAEEAFLKSELPGLIDKISKLNLTPTSLVSEIPDSSKTKNVSVSIIAQKLNETDGSGVIFAACCSLTLSGKNSFDRKAIIGAAKTATTYYKSSVRANMSGYLKTLCKSEMLNDLGSGRYSLGTKGAEVLKGLNK